MFVVSFQNRSCYKFLVDDFGVHNTEGNLSSHENLERPLTQMIFTCEYSVTRL